MNEYTITQITDNNINDIEVQVSEGNIVWSANDGNDTEIFFYNGSEISQLTNNEVFDQTALISGSNLVWVRTETDPFSSGLISESEIIFYDGTNSSSIANVEGVTIPAISGNNVAWGEGSFFGGRIFFYDGTSTSEISDSGVFIPINSSSISGDNLVWTSGLDQGYDAVFFYDGVTTTQINDNDLANVNLLPSVSGNNIAWTSAEEATTGNETGEIFFYDGTDTIQLTDDDEQKAVIGVAGNNVIWSSGDGLISANLFIYNGTETIQLTSDETEIFDGASISGNNVVWAESDGNDLEIFLYDGNTTTQITDNDLDDSLPDIDGDNIVWQANDGSDIEIFLATLNGFNSGENDPPGTVYRFFNNDTGVHFYTANETERNAVEESDNFSFEGASYISVDPLTGNSEPLPVYRFLNEDTGVHLYTISETERDVVAELDNFSFEGEAFFAYETEVEGSIPIYRFFNPSTGAHFYTPSAAERDNVADNLPDFQSEGIAYYAFPIETELS